LWCKNGKNSEKNGGGLLVDTRPGERLCSRRYQSGADGYVISNHGYYDERLARTDDNGNVKWKQSIGGAADDFALAVTFISASQIRSIGYTNINSNDLTGIAWRC
jgi:hypothetical protein